MLEDPKGQGEPAGPDPPGTNLVPLTGMPIVAWTNVGQSNDSNDTICDDGGIRNSDLPRPPVLNERMPFFWDEDAPPLRNYINLGRRLAGFGDLYRNPKHGSGLLMALPSPLVPPKAFIKGAQLAPAIADRLRIQVFKNGKLAGSMPSSIHLNTMLASEVFLQQFQPLDLVTTIPLYLPEFVLTKPGYNDGGLGQRVYYVGPSPENAEDLTVTRQFLDVMAFATDADRTNAVAAGLTTLLRNQWPGAKPMVVVTSTKSHGGKDTVIEFLAGRTPHASLSYEKQDWALQKNFASIVHHNPELGLINIENARMKGKDERLESSFLERFLTDAEPVLFSTGSGDPNRRKNNLVLAASTNFGKISEDLMNRALPIHLNPVGDVDQRKSPIGNPKLEFLPANRERIEAELRGMVERWKAAGKPLDPSVKHPFGAWAVTIGGVLKVSGFTDFLGNYNARKTEDDPLRQALGFLGAAHHDEWLRSEEWVLRAANLGLVNRLIPEADRESREGRLRGLGVVFSAHRDETFQVETEDKIVRTQLKKARKRWEPGEEPQTKYRFELLEEKPIPED